MEERFVGDTAADVKSGVVYSFDRDEFRRVAWADFIGRVHVVNALVCGHLLALLPAVFGFMIWLAGISSRSGYGAAAVIMAGLTLFAAYVAASLAAMCPDREKWFTTAGALCVLSCFCAWVCILFAFLS